MAAHTVNTRPLGALGRIGIVAALHVGVLYAIAKSLGFMPSLAPPERIETVLIEKPRPPDEVLPMPEVDLTPKPNTFVTPDEPLPLQFESDDVLTGPPPDDARPQQPPDIIAGPPVTAVRLDARHPLTQPPYPPRDVREGNTGTADIEVYVLPNGRVGDARIVRSSGFEGLDRSALAEAKRSWRLVPATRDGVPFAQWHRLRVVFKLNSVN